MVRFNKETLVQSPIPFLVLWVVFGALSIFVPLIQWNKKSNEYYQYYGQWQEQDENQDQDGENYYYPSCGWFQFQCRRSRYWYNAKDDQVTLPNWWVSTFAVAEEERRRQEENSETSSTMKFCYAWSLILFIAVIFYGCYAIARNRPLDGLVAALIMLINFSLLSMLMLSQGAIQDEGKELETAGFYGQLSVLVFMTHFWFFLHGIIFATLVGVRIFLLQRMGGGGNGQSTHQASDYHSFSSPEVKIVDGQRA